MKLPLSTIREMKYLVYNKRVETCANIDQKSLEINPDSIQEGEDENERGMCLYKYYTSIIFHTHPAIYYSYPSVEDIVKVIKNKKIIYHSLIATKWGIWKISVDDKGPQQDTIYKSDLYKKIINNPKSITDIERQQFAKDEKKLKNFINGQLDRIGFETSHKKLDNEVDPHKSADYDETLMTPILLDVAKIFNNSFPIKLTLYTWEELEDKTSYIEL